MLDQIYWHKAGRIIVERYSGLITLEDIQQAKEQALDMIRAEGQAPHVHIIIDAAKREAYAPEVMKLPTIRQMLRFDDLQARIGWLIIINANPHPIMRFLVTAAARISSNQLRIMSSMDEAINFLHFTDPTLSETNASS